MTAFKLHKGKRCFWCEKSFRYYHTQHVDEFGNITRKFQCRLCGKYTDNIKIRKHKSKGINK